MSPREDQLRAAELRWSELVAQTRDRILTIRNQTSTVRVPAELMALHDELDSAVRTIPWWRS